MKTKFLCIALCLLMLVGTFTACNDSVSEPADSQETKDTTSNNETTEGNENKDTFVKDTNGITYTLQRDGTYQLTFAPSGLIDVVIPETVNGRKVTSIGPEAFWDTHNYNNGHSLISIELPDSLTSIGRCAFSHCKSLRSISIPNGVKEIGESAFAECTELSEITIPNGVSRIKDSTFFGCDNLQSVTIASSVTIIEQYAFSCCDSLTSITIPEGVTEIQGFAFYKSGLETIVLPKGIKKIGLGTFQLDSDRSNLTDIYFTGTEAEWAEISKETAYIPATATIHFDYVPSN